MALIKHNLTDNSAFRIKNNDMRCDSCEKLFLHFVLQDETQPFFVLFLTACKTGPDANLLFQYCQSEPIRWIGTDVSQNIMHSFSLMFFPSLYIW